jgi:ribose transport system substrate-binding protein
MRKLLLAGVALAFSPTVSMAADLPTLNPDTETSRVSWSDVEKKFGPTPDANGQRYGVVLKTLTNEFWRLLADGYHKAATRSHASVDIQAAQGESDQMGQLSIMENMIGPQYKGLLISPQTDANLQPAIDEALQNKLVVVNVDDAVVGNIGHFVGVVQKENGVRVANWFIQHYKDGGEVAIVEGQAGVFAAIQRTTGFRETIQKNGKFKVVASVPGNWDRQQSYDAAVNILQRNPKIIGIYCNNDTMALGVVEAVKSLNLLNQVHVFGTDGTNDAYVSIKAGEMTGTVDSFPVLTGEIALDTAERLVAGQALPRVIMTPQALVTRENMARYKTSDEDAQKKALIADATSGQ